MGDDGVIIFDTTLRDGEQAAGINLNIAEKLQIAHQLARLKVDVIEAGFPAASEGDFEAVKRIAQEVKGPIIAGLARARKEDIKAAYEAVKYSDRPRIHTFIATSDIHMQYKLKMTREEVLKAVKEAVTYAKSLVDDVEFSAEDASRSELDFLVQVFKLALDCGATTLNIPDTVGYAYPGEFGEFVRAIIDKVDGGKVAIWSVHCHNDLGLAVANSLAGIKAGARQVECTINGLGERAGNAALEEIVMALRTRKDIFGLDTKIDTQKLYETSRLVSRLTGVIVPPNKAIVGANAFSHESGIHQHGVLCNRATYEIMRPEDVGFPGTRLYLGKHSGRHAFKKRLEEMGFNLSEEAFEKAFKLFKELCDRKEIVTDSDIEAFIADEIIGVSPSKRFELKSFSLTIDNGGKATATVTLIENGIEKTDAAVGNGPVDASYKAIRRIVGVDPVLKSYRIEATSERSDALGEAVITLQLDSFTVVGRGTSTDIIEASIKAYINALNRLFAAASLKGVELS